MRSLLSLALGCSLLAACSAPAIPAHEFVLHGGLGISLTPARPRGLPLQIHVEVRKLAARDEVRAVFRQEGTNLVEQALPLDLERVRALRSWPYPATPEQPILEVETSGGARQFYALVTPRRLALVSTEGGSWHLRPEPPRRSLSEWKEAIEAGGIRRLEAMAWIAGCVPQSPAETDALDLAILLQLQRDRPLRESLRGLMKSMNLWDRVAAMAADEALELAARLDARVSGS